MKKPIIGSNQNRRKLLNNFQVNRTRVGDIYKTFIYSKMHYLRIIHKNYLYNENSIN